MMLVVLQDIYYTYINGVIMKHNKRNDNVVSNIYLGTNVETLFITLLRHKDIKTKHSSSKKKYIIQMIQNYKGK